MKGEKFQKIRKSKISSVFFSPGDVLFEFLYLNFLMIQEYEFKCKPGSVTRRPCVISPYHYRLDWLMWFAAFQQYHHNPWFINLVAKLLEGNSEVRKLIDHDPFNNATRLPRLVVIFKWYHVQENLTHPQIICCSE